MRKQLRIADHAVFQSFVQSAGVLSRRQRLQQFGIGQPLPQAYSTYNVPLAYRDQYFDSNNDWYRYANGYIYRVDPNNGLIQEAIPVYA